ACRTREHERERNAQHERDGGRRKRAEEGKAERCCGLGRDERAADLVPRRADYEAGEREEEEQQAGRRQRQERPGDPGLAHAFSNPALTRIACPCEDRTNAMNWSAAERRLRLAIE